MALSGQNDSKGKFGRELHGKAEHNESSTNRINAIDKKPVMGLTLLAQEIETE